MFDGKAFGREIVEAVKGHIERAVSPINRRLAALEKRIDDLPAPRDGKDADLSEVRRMISEELVDITAAVNAIEPAPLLPDIPKMIEDALAARLDVEEMERSIEEVVRAVVAEIPPPKDGSSVTLEDVLPELSKQAHDFLAALPAPVDGKSVTLDEVAPLIASEVDKRVRELPLAKDGKDGRDGIDGRDGVGLAGALIDREGNLVVTLTNGEARSLGPVVGKDGDPGRPGQNGAGIDDFEAKLMPDNRTIAMTFHGKDYDYTAELGFPAMIYRGVFKEGEYAQGDTVTWGGSLWHCDADKTSEKPGDGSKDWTLCAKKGRDGKDGVMREAKATMPVRVGVPARGE